MFCRKCGKEIDDEALICPGCGCATQNFEINQQIPKAQFNKSWDSQELSKLKTLSTLAAVFAFFFPLVGLILGIVGTSKKSSINQANLSLAEQKTLKNCKTNSVGAIFLSLFIIGVHWYLFFSLSGLTLF